ETRRARQLWSDIREAERQDRIHLDLTLFHPVAVADPYVWTHPYANAASDFAAPNPVAQALREDHFKSLPVTAARKRRRSSLPRRQRSGRCLAAATRKQNCSGLMRTTASRPGLSEPITDGQLTIPRGQVCTVGNPPKRPRRW